MSKDKGGKALKKAPNLNGKKDPSDYQTDKTTASKTDVIITNKKHN